MAAKKKMMKKSTKKMSSGAAKGDMKKMSPKDRFKMMMEQRKQKGKQKASITAKKPKKVGSTKNKLTYSGALSSGKKIKVKMSGGAKKKAMKKMSITAKKPKVVKHKKKGRV